MDGFNDLPVLREWCYGERVESLRILPATLGASAGWIGAARLALG